MAMVQIPVQVFIFLGLDLNKGPRLKPTTWGSTFGQRQKRKEGKPSIQSSLWNHLGTITETGTSGLKIISQLILIGRGLTRLWKLGRLCITRFTLLLLFISLEHPFKSP